jgi:hypothetical protein
MQIVKSVISDFVNRYIEVSGNLGFDGGEIALILQNKDATVRLTIDSDKYPASGNIFSVVATYKKNDNIIKTESWFVDKEKDIVENTFLHI